jgi:hypothetical protein
MIGDPNRWLQSPKKSDVPRFGSKQFFGQAPAEALFAHVRPISRQYRQVGHRKMHLPSCAKAEVFVVLVATEN